MTSQSSQDSHNSQVSPSFTCGDCRHFKRPVAELAWCTLDDYSHDASEPICPYFETKDGLRPRFCRLASSVDEMAAALVDWHYAEGHKYWTYTGSLKRYDSCKDALAAAKQYLLALENGGDQRLPPGSPLSSIAHRAAEENSPNSPVSQ